MTVFNVGEAESEKSAKNMVSATLAVCEPLVPVTVKLSGAGTPFTGLALFAVRPVVISVLDYRKGFGDTELVEA